MGESEAKPQKEGTKREYIAPKLETLGTIRDLTHGQGQFSEFDSTHPPGQNKSRI